MTCLIFNSASPTIMHLDLNSCFASIEQQVNPLLRGKPIAIAAYVSPGGCILAACVEAVILPAASTSPSFIATVLTGTKA